ncbi:hypothetical protein [Nostoc sp. KVJ3]|uniref:hypothetical protein n=1 Tax=Nostoc sp. KVJ3 TaxID=457945 RepID=UPI002238D9EA|nr:hypothetical protein [Nostoc sp. KVJ3]
MFRNLIPALAHRCCLNIPSFNSKPRTFALSEQSPHPASELPALSDLLPFLIKSGASYAVWSSCDAVEAANIMLEALKTNLQ